MIKLFFIIWVLIGVVVVIYGIIQKKKYAYRSPATFENLIIIIVCIIIWPISLNLILNYVVSIIRIASSKISLLQESSSLLFTEAVSHLISVTKAIVT